MKVVVLDVLFVSSFMTLKCLLYHSNQGVLAYEKAVLKYSRNQKRKNIVAREATIPLLTVRPPNVEFCFCFGPSVSFKTFPVMEHFHCSLKWKCG